MCRLRVTSTPQDRDRRATVDRDDRCDAVHAGRMEIDRATGASYRRGELLVRFKDGLPAEARVQALQRSRTSRMLRTLPENWELVALDRGTSLTQTIDALTRSGVVEQVSLNYRVTTQQARPNDEDYRLQWNFDAINMPSAWQINPGARNDVTVAVVDTGLNTINDTLVYSSPIVGQVSVRFSMVPDLVTDARITNAFDFVPTTTSRSTSRPRHSRGRHRAADEQQHRRGGHRLQREVDAVEGALRRLLG